MYRGAEAMPRYPSRRDLLLRRDRVLADPVFAYDAVRHRDGEMSARRNMDRRANAHVRLKGEAKTVGQFGDPAAFRNSAGATDIWLHDIDRAVANEFDG